MPSETSRALPEIAIYGRQPFWPVRKG